MSEKWELIESSRDWKWYKKGLDYKARYEHRHQCEPETYPCKVRSTWHDDPNGPYYYVHEFIYMGKVKCLACGDIELVWPDELNSPKERVSKGNGGSLGPIEKRDLPMPP